MDFAGVLHAMMARWLGLALAGSLAGCTQAAAPLPAEAGLSMAEGAPSAAPRDGDRQLLWGDTHVHTRNSSDAYENGGTNADLESAYRFAKGYPVLHPRTGLQVHVGEPLDFIVVADHAEMLGIMPRLAERDPQILATNGGRELYEQFRRSTQAVLSRMVRMDPDAPMDAALADVHSPAIRQTSWDAQIAAAERHNEPGKFTALIGWEWSSTPNGLNQHRVVFTPAGGAVARQFLPLSNFDATRPEELWAFLRETRARTGADFIAIPHNANLSNGLMFARTDSTGRPLDASYARERMAWESVVEVTQYKGTSETHPGLSPRDEFAGYEIRNILLTGAPARHEPGSYLRPALLAGLDQEARIGVNPFAFGLIGATDSHSGFSSVEEEAFLGKSGGDLLPSERAAGTLGNFGSWDISAAGLAGVWADRNDRQSVFEAFRRREVFATTGPRIGLRLFAGYGFVPGDEEARDFGRIGYRKGVPMGGELVGSRDGRGPAFVIRAVKDPRHANLDRVQMIKGWRDSAGRLQEKVFDVAWSGERRIGADGKLPPVGNTVDVSNARWRNTIGAAELTALWRDPEFKADEAAFYYVRVLQIPTPRHHLYDALALGMDPRTLSLPPFIQERAYSSPVWYRP